MKKLFLLLTILIVFSSCTTECNENIPKRKSILVLGNSITKCQPGGEWTGNWGMAASSPNKDFCGILSKYYELESKNIAIWENDFNCSEEHYKFVTSKKYDFIIIKIGENVSNLVDFKQELTKLTDFYSNYTNKIILVTTVWKQYDFDTNGNPFEVPSVKDKIITEVALENNIILVNISKMKDDSNYYAWNEYQNNSIASHPNDLGMEFIANSILEKINQ